jgi:SAM-dependent methyltransferase
MKNQLITISQCEVCGNTPLPTVLDLGEHPMCDDLLPVGSDNVCREYPIKILYCTKCRTAHQAYQIPKTLLFPDSYHYRSRFTKDVLDGMQDLVNSVERRLNSIKKRKVLDIGCNDGSLLDYFRAKDCLTFGIEPTAAAEDARAKGHIIERGFLSQDIAKDFVSKHGQPDIITFTNVFAHIENLSEVVESLLILMSPFTLLVIENHYLGMILKKKQFDTFYHEHPRTYSATSFVHIAKRLNASLVSIEFPARYGGNIRVMITMNSATNLATLPEEIELSEVKFESEFSRLPIFIDHWKSRKIAQLSRIFDNQGKIEAKAFPGRASILIKLLGLTEVMINAVYEKPGSIKIGNYLPGTRIPILSDDKLFPKLRELKTILNLAWHIPDEIETYLRAAGFTGIMMNIIDASDFNTSDCD